MNQQGTLFPQAAHQYELQAASDWFFSLPAELQQDEWLRYYRRIGTKYQRTFKAFCADYELIRLQWLHRGSPLI